MNIYDSIYKQPLAVGDNHPSLDNKVSILTRPRTGSSLHILLILLIFTSIFSCVLATEVASGLTLFLVSWTTFCIGSLNHPLL